MAESKSKARGVSGEGASTTSTQILFEEIVPVHIKEYDMVADSCTKYIKRDTWARHMHYVLNLPGDPPNCNGDTKLNAA